MQGIKDAFWYIITLPVRLYIVTWSYFLIWRKRQIPKWLQQRTIDELTYQPLGKAEPYKR